MRFILILIIFNFVFVNANTKELIYHSKNNLLNDYNFYAGNNSYHAIIEISSGSQEKWEISNDGRKIQREFSNGLPRTINYLGYLGNYGFIPQTLLSIEEGGDGDAVDVLVIGKKLDRGSLVKIKILGMLSLEDDGLIDNKVIGVLEDSEFSKSVSGIGEFKKKYPGILNMIEIWFQNYKGYKLKTSGFLGKKITKRFIIKANSNYKLRNNILNDQ